jgi:hypothetical protein
MKPQSLVALLVTAGLSAAVAQQPPRGEPIKPLAPKGQPIKPADAGAPSKSPSTETSTPGVQAKSEGQLVVGFDKLSGFKYEVPDENPESPFANGKKGFMLPLKVEQGLVTELLIMRDQSMCCFGTVPKINEWVSVRMTGKGIKPVMDQAVSLVGTLKVGAIRENGYLVGIYQMDGERMDGPVGL